MFDEFLHTTIYVTVVQPSCSRAARICGLPEPDGAKAAVSLEVISGVRSPQPTSHGGLRLLLG